MLSPGEGSKKVRKNKKISLDEIENNLDSKTVWRYLRENFTEPLSNKMLWTPELASYLDDAPWPATKEELIDYALRIGAPREVILNLQELEENVEMYESMEEIWPDYAVDDSFYYDDDDGEEY